MLPYEWRLTGRVGHQTPKTNRAAEAVNSLIFSSHSGTLYPSGSGKNPEGHAGVLGQIRFYQKVAQ